VQRGHNREASFFADEDRLYYLEQLQRLLPAHGCALHAYVLMTNHVHLLLTPETETSAALLMKRLSQRYGQYVNRTYRRSGTIWGGRFRSSLVQTETYLLTYYRYIELNAVRAGMVKHPSEYR
jgi:putative transposase